MKVKFESKGGFDNAVKWMKDTSKIDSSIARDIGEFGKSRLQAGTPEDTGETAFGWEYDVVQKPTSLEVSWKNISHPESQVNVAKLIELGHATGTSGYVPPRPYIKQSMEPVWDKLDKEAEELMK